MRQRPYSSSAYVRARAIVLEAAGYQCQVRGPHCTGRANTVDHVLAITAGGTHDLDNLRAACLACNSRGGALITNARRKVAQLGRGSRPW